MKPNSRLNVVAVAMFIILPGFMIIMSIVALYQEIKSAEIPHSLKWPGRSLLPGFRAALVDTRCYQIPYNHEQLKKIWKDGGEEKKELNRIILKKTENEDLSKILAPPRVVFGSKFSMVCLDFKKGLLPEQNPFIPHLI